MCHSYLLLAARLSLMAIYIGVVAHAVAQTWAQALACAASLAAVAGLALAQEASGPAKRQEHGRGPPGTTPGASSC